MRFGSFNLLQKRDPVKRPDEVYRDTLDMVRLAEDIGFETAWVAEHHFSDYSLCPSPLLACAWLAGKTSRIKLAPGVIVAPLYEPARLVQECAMVDLASEGRFVLGLGTGYQVFEFERFGLDLAEAGDRTLEILDILERGLSEGVLVHQGRYYNYPESLLSVRLHDAMPEVYMAGVLNHPGIRARVAERGYAPLLAPGWNPISLVEEQKVKYDALVREAGKDPADAPFAVMRFLCVTDDKAETLRAADDMRYSTRVAAALRFQYAEFDGTTPKDQPAQVEPSLEAMVENALIGPPEKIAEQIVYEARSLKPNHVALFAQYGRMTASVALNSLERFAKEILPLVEQELCDLSAIGAPAGRIPTATADRPA